ncbi:MAG: hypothetical protein V4654_04530 [Bdellovibrionota bacterium]
MKTKASTFCIIALIAAATTACIKEKGSQKAPVVEDKSNVGGVTGGGGFAATNSEKLLLDVVQELASEIKMASEDSFTSLPTKWTKEKLISVISNIELKYDVTKYREDKELIFDYDQQSNKIFALRSFFLAYASVPQESVSYFIKKDIKIKLLHEVAHLMYKGELEAESFAVSTYTSMQNELIACWDQQDVVDINLNTYKFGFVFPVIGGYGVICGPFNPCDVDRLALDDSYYSKYAKLFGFDDGTAPLIKGTAENEYSFSDKKIQLSGNIYKIHNSVGQLIKKTGSQKDIVCTFFNRKNKSKFFQEEKKMFVSDAKPISLVKFLDLVEKCEPLLSKDLTQEEMSSANKTGNINCQQDPTDTSIYECSYQPTLSLYAKSKSIALDNQIPDILFESDRLFANEISNIQLLQRKSVYTDLKLTSYVNKNTLQVDTKEYAACVAKTFNMKN